MLLATAPVWIDEARVYPNLADKSARIRVQIGNVTGRSGAGVLSVASQRVPVTLDQKARHVS